MSVWDAVVGQPEIVAQLRMAAEQPAAMTHAWLFTGPPGSGRSTAARAFAAELECDTRTGCGTCQGCRMVLAGTHPDVIQVATDLVTIKIAEVKDLVASAAAKPMVGRYRIFLVEDADRMQERTVNVLLKAIEEPVSTTVWLLCAPTLTDVLPTIRSRCRALVLRTPPADAVAELLEREGVAPDVAQVAARASQSHVGRARALATDPDALKSRAAVLEVVAKARSVPMAVVQAGVLADLAKADAAAATEQRNAEARAQLLAALGLGEKDPIPPKLRSQFKELEDDQKRRARRGQQDVLHRYFQEILTLLRDVLVIQLGAEVDLINGGARSSSALVAMLAKALSPDETFRRIEAVRTAEARLGQNVPAPLALEAMLVSLRW